ncbi:hypothetical protein CcaCcLH18_10116 [Colletotrichum camelliae]|nr:hypothetical protein CcaCcLH18_10116 [Colletotrichum camelliae]
MPTATLRLCDAASCHDVRPDDEPSFDDHDTLLLLRHTPPSTSSSSDIFPFDTLSLELHNCGSSSARHQALDSELET